MNRNWKSEYAHCTTPSIGCYNEEGVKVHGVEVKYVTSQCVTQCNGRSVLYILFTISMCIFECIGLVVSLYSVDVTIYI